MPYTTPTALTLNYTIISPTNFTYDSVSVSNNYVVFTLKNASMWDGETQLIMQASYNSTLYTTVTMVFNITCPIDCLYCLNSTTCEVCNDPYYWECETISDSDYEAMRGWGVTIILFAFMLAATGFCNFKVNMDFWIIVNAIQIA